MAKEVSDKIVYLLLVLAILISILGTFFVYYKASEINGAVAQNVDNLFIKEQPSEGHVGVYVTILNETEKKET
ncbi:hypothetical protein HYT51_01090 [Candidatus Woesearchaeota archaeon]|nr:hypothetical protein [Candidatus Woesearchaeota archaeon]